MSRSKAQPQLPIEDKVRMVCYGVDPGVLLGVCIRLLHERPHHDRHEHLELTSTSGSCILVFGHIVGDWTMLRLDHAALPERPL